MRIFLGAFGDPGHAFPMLALGSRLVERGHDVLYQTWRKWTLDVEAAGMSFTAAPETSDSTIVMLTAATDDAAERRASEAGADLFLTKPFSPLDLLRLVDRIGAEG